MNESLEAWARRLAEARQRGDADEIAEALARHANELVRSGQIAAARQELDEAAEIHHRGGRAYDEARCTEFAATLCRLEGLPAEAERRARRALELSQSAGGVAVSANAELGEIALSAGRAADAVAAYDAALRAAEGSGLAAAPHADLLRKRAVARAAATQYAAAARDLEAAYDLLTQAGDRATATRALIEEATALRHAGSFAEAGEVVRRAMSLAEPANDRAALADLYLLVAAAALDRRDASAAMAAARAAREHALAANAPTPYIGAAIAIAQLSEAAGDRLAAYEALAVGWATLADLLGADLARTAFAPKLEDLRNRWGAAAFEEIKKDYEARRRATRGR